MQEVFEKIVKKLKDWTFNADVIMPNEERLNNRRLIASENAIEIVKQEAEQYNNGWIPCSERLPEESLQSVMGWDEYRERICFVHFIRGRFILGDDTDSVNIIAWQPLPAPYNPSGEHKKKTNFDRCRESMEAMAQIIDIAKIGWTKDQIMEWLQKEECEVPE